MDKFRGLIIAAIYTVVAGFFVLPINRQSFINSAESLYFDGLQRQITIDSKSDADFMDYSNLLSDLVFINIDSLCINSLTDKVKKPYIVSFLDSLASHKHEFKSVFLDYDLSFLNSNDTLFLDVLKNLDGQLITPRLLFAKSLAVAVQNPIPDSLIVSYTENYNIGNLTGYAYGWKENFTHTYRYYLYRVFTPEMKTYNSIPFIMADRHWPSRNISFDKHLLDDLKEIKYILRNSDLPNKERAVMTYSLSDVINEIPREAMGGILKDKIVFVGLFENYTNKYNQQVDSYVTPVDENMSGILITANAFLNLMAQNYIKIDKGIFSIVFVFLFTLLASVFQLFASRSKAYSRPLLWYFIFIVITIAGILLFTNILWLNFNIRVHFITSSIAILLSWPVFAIFRK